MAYKDGEMEKQQGGTEPEDLKIAIGASGHGRLASQRPVATEVHRELNRLYLISYTDIC